MFTLYTAATPNGYKVTTLLEELEVEYQVHSFDLSKRDHKDEWYLEINPNGRIPALLDHDNGDFAIFESGAILVYLAEKYGKFMPSDVKGRSTVLQWVFFQMAGIGPMLGLTYSFLHVVPEKIPYAIDRFSKESRRLLEVLNRRLKGREYLADEYSIADMATYPWVSGHKLFGIPTDDLVDLQAWLHRMSERPAVRRGFQIPHAIGH